MYSLSEENYLKISIADTGKGIPLENYPYIFSPYFTTKNKGNGLGLATCYSIIKQHKGIIEFSLYDKDFLTAKLFFF